jgi:hypothetical protein
MGTSIRVYLPAGGAHIYGRGEMNTKPSVISHRRRDGRAIIGFAETPDDLRLPVPGNVAIARKRRQS